MQKILYVYFQYSKQNILFMLNIWYECIIIIYENVQCSTRIKKECNICN